MVRVTLTVCLAAAAATVVVGFAGCGWSLALAADAIVVPMVVGPYAALAVVAWLSRRSRSASVAVLMVVLAVAGFGLFAFGTDAYRAHTDPQHGMAMHLEAVVVPVVQGLATALLALVLATVWLATRGCRAA